MSDKRRNRTEHPRQYQPYDEYDQRQPEQFEAGDFAQAGDYPQGSYGERPQMGDTDDGYRRKRRPGHATGHAEERAYTPASPRQRRQRDYEKAPAYAEDHRGRGPRNYTRSNERIFEDACDNLTDDHVVDASDIEVLVEDGEVTLNGTVPSRRQKRRAEDCVECVSGVNHVQNNLRVQQEAAAQRITGVGPLA